MRAAAAALSIFLLNVAVAWRLFHTEYLAHLGSIEGAFISLAGYIQQRHPGYEWFPLWFEGMPFSQAYQPLLPHLVAALAPALGRSPAYAYHVLTAFTYSLGGVAMFALAWALSGSRVAGLCAGGLWSLFSPSLLLFPLLRDDVGGLWNAKRLQALVVYGEGPNVTGLTLLMFALALLYQALAKRGAAWTIAAAAACALVAATSWPSTVALGAGALCYVAVMPRALARATLIAALAYGLACPFALPSTVLRTFANANGMGDGVTAGAVRFAAWALLLTASGAAAFMARRFRLPAGFGFAVLYSLVLIFVVGAAQWFGIRVTPQPARFHLALEIGLILTAVFIGRGVSTRWPRSRPVLGALLIALCVFQFVNYRGYARRIIERIDIHSTIEYQAAQWFERNVQGQRVYAPGSISFWMNAFTNTPQVAGCCDQAVQNPNAWMVNYIIAAGYGNEEQDAGYSLLWMKAYAVQAVAVGGAHSREHYKTFAHPYKFAGRLPAAWNSGDDFIFRVPQRASGLARVVRAGDLVRDPPVNGIDVAGLRAFVAALDDPSLPLLDTEWPTPGRARIHGILEPGHVIQLAVNYHRGWTAAVNGRPLAVQKDGLGFIVLEPQCGGACAIDLQWTPGPEPYVAWSIALLTAIGMLTWIAYE